MLPSRPYPPHGDLQKYRIFTLVEAAESKFCSHGHFIDDDVLFNRYDTCIRSDGQTQYGELPGAFLNMSQDSRLFPKF